MNYLETAVKAAKEAGKIHLKYFQTKLKIKIKSSRQDRLTIADTESEKKIVSIIKKNFSGHNFLAEENKYKETDSEYLWIIDPLDGTNNFSHAYPIFTVSIALAFKDKIILGVIYNPNNGEMFIAEKSKGASLNGKKIQVSKVSDLKDSLMITGFYYNRGIPMLRNLVNIKKFFLQRINGLRRSGSAAYDLCNIASGRADGFWEFYLNAWDFAAGKLIVEEAGGRVTNKAGEKLKIKPSYVVASNDKIHDIMLKILNREV